MEKKYIFVVIVIAVLAGFWLFTAGKNDIGEENPVLVESSEVTSSGKQLIEIFAKGGYTPRQISAKAGEESILRVNTKNTFDCSTALVIPSLSYQAQLKPTGSVDIPIPAQASGSKLVGTCSMGMYSFEIMFN